MTIAELRSADWVHANPTFGADLTHGTRMYFFEQGCQFGYEEDGKTWYRISCSYWFGDWIEEQDEKLWWAYGSPHRAIYLVSEELMMIVQLKWL